MVPRTARPSRHHPRRFLLRPILLALLVVGVVVLSFGPIAVTASSPSNSPHAMSAPTSTDWGQTSPSAQQYDATNPPTLDSDTTYWQGWAVSFDASAIIDSVGSASEQDRTFHIRRATSDNRIGDQLATFTVDTDGHATIDTTPLSGNVVILYKGDVVHSDGGVGDVTSTADGSTPSVANSKWSVTEQTLDATWSPQSFYDGEPTTLTLTSNRDDFTIAASSSKLSFEELEQIFPESSFAPNHDARRNDSVLLLVASDRTTATLNFTNVTPDTYTVTFSATDTTGEARTAVAVKEPNPNAHFERVQRSQHAGDSLTATVACSQCYLVIGGADDGIIDLLEVSDQTGDGQVSITINTRYAGLDSGGPGAPTGVRAYTAGEDDVTVFRSSHTLATGRTLGNVRSDLGLSSTGRDAPLTPGTYSLTVSTTTHLRAHPPEDSTVLRMRDTADVTTIRLTDPALTGIESLAGPRGLPRDVTIDDLANRAGPRDEIVIGDQLIVRIDATGLFGYLTADGNDDLTAIMQNEGEGIDFHIRGDNSVINPESSRARLLTDPDNNHVYVVIDTRHLRGDNRAITAGQSFTATVTLNGIDADRSRYSVYPPDSNYHGYPYLLPGETATEQTTFTLVGPEGSTAFSTHDTGDVRVPDESDWSIEGTTKLAPSSRFTVTAVSEGSGGWSTEGVARVDANGTWSATLDFSAARPGQSFTVTATRNSNQLATASGTVVDISEISTPTPTGDGSGAGNQANDDGSGTQGGLTNPLGDTEQSVLGRFIPDIAIPGGRIGRIVIGALGLVTLVGVGVVVLGKLRG